MCCRDYVDVDVNQSGEATRTLRTAPDGSRGGGGRQAKGLCAWRGQMRITRWVRGVDWCRASMTSDMSADGRHELGRST